MPFQKGHKLNLGNQYNKGRINTPEYKENMSRVLKGNTNGFKKGMPSCRKGKKMTMPIWNKGLKGVQAKENHPRWIADRTKIVGRHNRSFHDSEMKQWRTNVYKRDNFKCKIANQDCDGRLEAHHILGWKDYPELRYEVNNGITLCHHHHPRKRVDETKLIPTFLKLIDLNIPQLN